MNDTSCTCRPYRGIARDCPAHNPAPLVVTFAEFSADAADCMRRAQAKCRAVTVVDDAAGATRLYMSASHRDGCDCPRDYGEEELADMLVAAERERDALRKALTELAAAPIDGIDSTAAVYRAALVRLARGASLDLEAVRRLLAQPWCVRLCDRCHAPATVEVERWEADGCYVGRDACDAHASAYVGTPVDLDQATDMRALAADATAEGNEE